MTQVGHMETALSKMIHGTLLNNTKTNPKEHVKATTTRSGVKL